MDGSAAERFGLARVARMATVRPGRAPRLVPVTFAVRDDTVWTAVDGKPKSTRRLGRLADLEHDHRLSLLVDSYDEDWRRLWWVRADGTGRVVPADSAEGATGLAALVAKYEQYRRDPPRGPVIVVHVDRWTSWSATPAD